MMPDRWPFHPLSPGRYDFIMADPPWSFKTYSPKGHTKKTPQGNYSCMSRDDILTLPVGRLAAPHCVLWLWGTFPMLPDAMETMAAWGFRYVTGGCWHKKTRNGLSAFGTGYRLRSAAEPFLIGVHGKPKTTRTVRNIVEARTREHSRKPDEAYRSAERMMPLARRADLFARETRDGWDGWGDQSAKFDQRTLFTERGHHAA